MRPASSAQSPKPPAVSGAGANVNRSAGALGPTPVRRRMPTMVGVGTDPAEEPTSSPKPVDVPAAPDSADDAAWDADGAVTTTNADVPVPTPTPPAVAAAPPPVPTPTPTPIGLPPVARKPPVASGTTRDPEQTAPQTALSMSNAMREEVWAIVRAAVQDAVAPLAARNRELDQRLTNAERNLERERSERERLIEQAKEAVLAASRPQPRAGGNSIPVSIEASIPPAPLVVGAPAVPNVFLEGPKMQAAPRASLPAARMPAKVPGGSIPPTGLGVVVTAGPSPLLDLSRVDVGVIDLPDFGRRRRLMGRLIVGLMLVGVIAAVVMTILSHN